ncbi:MAG TPA: response regulator, partial [Anaeromyxobacteraceae bacterium]|nr:response regulator [Anaeromyxobacteraceae bacterium]
LAAEDRLRRLEREVMALRSDLAAEARALSQGTRRLAAEVRELRLVPWGEAAAGLDRVARDAADALGKEVELSVEGAGLELDGSLVAALREPLGHLVRNAVDHGIEPPAQRAAAGKPRRGLLRLAAEADGIRVQVQVADDGRGLDPEALRAAALRRGVTPPADPARLVDLVFLPGFSTREEVGPVSGRGVGLDAVASAIRALRGTVAVASTPGRGSTFTLALPTSLHGVRAIVARDGGQAFGLPAADVERVVRAAPDRLRSVEGRPVLLLDAPLPAAPLHHLLGLDGGSWDPAARPLAVVLASRGRRGALLVEAVLAERELAIEALPDEFAALPFVAGAALLAAGELAVVLRPEELLDALAGRTVAAPATTAPAPARRRRIVLADDAATTRALARSLLEAAGYEVQAVPDGEAALNLLSAQGADLVVSDVEMPRRDGVELTRAIRSTPRLARLPVVLLTALASDEDRRRGLEAGADAYLTKGAFDQRVLLDTVADLLQGDSS